MSLDPLAEFLTARYAEDDEALRDPEWFPAQPDRWVLLVRHWDHVQVHGTLVRTYLGTTDPTARAVLRVVLLTLAQPYEPHPDFDPAWTAELAARLTPMPQEEQQCPRPPSS
ncbi:MAG: hypothetical protein KBF43_09050 [Dermatophilaceae bacterium]|nr:hypothetical protein [Dermatophilaceae bacterium]MBP9918719.1 hypothetical protein [Dermatophilaceae bacterium]